MKRKLLPFIGGLLLVLSTTGCNGIFNSNKEGDHFGDFGYNGVFLKEYAIKQIDVNQAKELIDIQRPVKTYSYKKRLNDYNDENIKIVLTKYASLKAVTKYYVSDREEQQVRKDIYQGTDFKFLLETNHYEPFGQMSVKYIFVDDALLDGLERENAEYILSEEHYTSPFNEPYTYHTNELNQLIVQTHHFAELPASIGGGIGSTFRQDCELIFDSEGKILLWQSSLGLYTSTPTGTVKEGYVFEVEFEWIEK